MKRIVALTHIGGFAIVCMLNAERAVAQDTQTLASKDRSVTADEASSPTAPRPGLLERTVSWTTDKMDRRGGSKDGIYPDLSAPIPGSGWLSAGVGYRHHLFGDTVVASASATMSTRRYSSLQSTIQWPRLMANRLTIAAQAKYQDLPQINYFGIGSASSKSAQTDYRLKDLDLAGSARFRAREHLAVGVGAGYLGGPGILPGLSSIHPSIEQRFSEATAPGLTGKTRYAHADAFVEADNLDVPGYPSSGGLYRVGLAQFQDLSGSGRSFRRVDVDAAHYVPLFNENWIVAIRGRVTMSQDAGQGIPFYLLPTLGGTNSLRGYSDYRFRDRNVAFVNVEYRWPVFRMLDAALFVDGGSVGPKAASLWQGRPHHDYGFGLRAHTATKSIARIEFAKGSEGVRVVASISAPFGASRSVAPYVP